VQDKETAHAAENRGGDKVYLFNEKLAYVNPDSKEVTYDRIPS
jgi:hypothetical protein